MGDQQPGKFRLSLDDDIKETRMESLEADPRRRKRTSSGVYILLIIVIIGMGGAYYDLYRRVTRSQSVGLNQVENIDSRLAFLLAKQAELDEQLSSKTSQDQQTIKALEERFNKIDTATKDIGKQLATKISKSNLNTAMASVNNQIKQTNTSARDAAQKLETLKANLEKIKTLDKSLKATQSKLATTQEDLSGEINEITLQLDRSSKNLIELKSQADNLAATRIDKKTAESLIKKRLQSQPPVSSQIAGTLSDHGKRIDSIKRNLNELKDNATIYENEILKIKRQLKAFEMDLQSLVSKRTSSSLPASTGAFSVSGDRIHQQNLKE